MKVITTKQWKQSQRAIIAGKRYIIINGGYKLIPVQVQAIRKAPFFKRFLNIK
jgi:hypothetical protein